jgi:hypothetical protein
MRKWRKTICEINTIVRSSSLTLPMWRNGRRGRLKIYSDYSGVGSSPIIGKFFLESSTEDPLY